MPTSLGSQLHFALGPWCPPQEPLLSLRYPPWRGPSLVSFPQSPNPPALSSAGPCQPASLRAVPSSPVVSKSFCTLTVKCASSSKHDGGVKVSNDTRHSTGCCDAGLGTTIPSLECSQNMGDLYAKGNGSHPYLRGQGNRLGGTQRWERHAAPGGQ